MEERITEFTCEGKSFVYIELSNIKNNDVFVQVAENVKQTITKYPEHSVYTITNIENVIFDTDTKKLAVDYMKHNAPYVKHGVLIGLDAVTKIMANAIFKSSGREPLKFLYTKEKAIEWLLQQE